MAYQECPLKVKLGQFGETELKFSVLCYVYAFPSFQCTYITIENKMKTDQGDGSVDKALTTKA